MQSKIINKYSDYVYWYFGVDYQMHRYEKLFERIGGRSYAVGRHVKGVIICTNLVQIPKYDDCVRVLTMHGTSNKHQRQHYGEDGKTNYDYYWVSGPKARWMWKKIGHKQLWKKGVKIGSFVSDIWFNDDLSRKQLCKSLKLDEQKKILLFTPSFGAEALIHGVPHLEALTKEYNILVKAHPFDKINDNKYEWVNLVEGNVYKILYMADVLITDSSSLMYDYAVTGRPLILMDLQRDGWIWDPPKYNMRDHAVRWNIYKDKDVQAKIETAKYHVKEIKKLFEDSFYFNDGKATDRAYDWLINLIEKRFL